MPLGPPSLSYATFGARPRLGTSSSSNPAATTTRVELINEYDGSRLEDWKDDSDSKSVYGSEISKEDADITTALIVNEGGPLGEPEAKRKFWFLGGNDKGKAQDLDAIATQVSRLAKFHFTRLARYRLLWMEPLTRLTAQRL